jgi:hypothetical protein
LKLTLWWPLNLIGSFDCIGCWLLDSDIFDKNL